MPHENNNEDLKASLTDNEVSKIVNSERLHQAIKETHDAWEKTKFKWQIFVALIMAFSAAFGYYLKWDSDRKDRIEQQIQVANERKAEEIRAVINQKMVWMRNTDAAIMDMRKTHELIVLGCKYHITRNLYKENVERFIARDELARAFDGIRFIFNNNVEQTFLTLTSFDEKINDVCIKSAPTDIIWHQYIYNLNNLMNQSINYDKKNLLKLN